MTRKIQNFIDKLVSKYNIVAKYPLTFVCDG